MAMPVLRIGLLLGALGFLYVSWASYDAGFPVEVALVRGVLSFMAVGFVAYLGELVVATAPPRPAAQLSAGAAADGNDMADHEPELGSHKDDGRPGGNIEATPDLAALIPTSIANDNEELQAA
jgi:hypothetical protein